MKGCSLSDSHQKPDELCSPVYIYRALPAHNVFLPHHNIRHQSQCPNPKSTSSKVRS